MTLREDKRDLRATVQAARAALGATRRAELSAQITAHLLALPAFGPTRTLAGYLSIGDEFDTSAFLQQALAAGHRLVLPRMVDPDSPQTRRLLLHAVSDIAGDTVPGRWGIREPDPARCPAVQATEVDLILVPGLAFDARGARLGYGAGYYDRLLVSLRPDCLRVSAAFSVQRVDRVPVEPHDQPVGALVTEAGAKVTGMV